MISGSVLQPDSPRPAGSKADVYNRLEERFRRALERHIRGRYKVDVPVVVERPPKLAMGECASPVCFELAKRLKKAPRALAQEIAPSLLPIEGVARVEVAGGGYLNAFFDRAAFFRWTAEESGPRSISPPPGARKVIVEHTSVNPNKAAHIGHLRNAVLGDTLARILRQAGHRVEVQNYIDNTGVQVADVVLGFLHLQGKSPDAVRALIASQPRFDYYCWDLYARVTEWLAEDNRRLELRAQTLKEIEEDRGSAAETAQIVSTAIVRRHLETLDRLGVTYDLLSRESDILHLKFWDAAFDMLKRKGAIRLAASGKNAGCWVMQLGPGGEQAGTRDTESAETPREEPPEEAEAKIIVRSNGTVTYVGKDIAYHLWKFGLLDRDFHYRRFHFGDDGGHTWVTATDGNEPGAPEFGHAGEVYNVIDSRQAYPQQVVVAGLRALGYTDQADHLQHFSYNVVALTPRCAEEMGYQLAPEEARKPYVEVSGRKGQGVKADDLIDQLEAGARREVDARHPDTPERERAAIAHAIAVGALRYFLLRFTRSTVIAFDFKDALSFEGETGPYAQYAVVRVNGILRKSAARDPELDSPGASAGATRPNLEGGLIDPSPFLLSPAGDDLWELVLLAGSLDARIEAAAAAQEPAFLARYAFELAQAFNVFYHKHHILSEENAQKRAFLLHLTWLVREQLVATLRLMGIDAPEKM
ncbi:MAG TPA: arginine--tRNA ligase [Candidatus Cybelea sp.]|nr:arginine--tRNA ligase [Candidatus Cybelea sp.]